MIDIGVITGSGISDSSGSEKTSLIQTRFGEAEVAVTEVGPWSVGSIRRHGEGHRHLPHTVNHRANIAALKRLGARAVFSTTAVGALAPDIALGRPIIFDDLFFPANSLPNGEPCTFFTEPGDPERGHLIWDEPFSPRLRRKLAHAASGLGLEVRTGGVYAHTNGPRFETPAEIRWLASLGATTVSQTCGPEVVLAGELELPYALVGFPVNHATGVSETEDDLDAMFALAAEVMPRLVFRAVESLEEADLAFDHGYVYRFE